MTEPITKPQWTSLINESVHTIEDVDIGDINAISRDFIVVKRGYVNVHYYYIPISKVEGWDGHVLWLKITEEEVKTNYERNIIPDPTRYYVKDYPYYSADNYPEVVIIQPRYKRPVFTTPPPTYNSETSPSSNRLYVYDLCNGLSFNTADELTKHVSEQH
jgi:hypothetical protein